MVRLQYKKAITMEDRVWKQVVAEQAKMLFELATNEDLTNQIKKVRAEGPYQALKEALKTLGVLY